MSLETIIKRASDMNFAIGKRTAYMRVLELMMDTSTGSDPSRLSILVRIIDAVRAMDDEAKAEYEVAKRSGDAT